MFSTYVHSTFTVSKQNLVEEAEDLSSNVLASCLLMVHDTSRGGEDDIAELTRWQQLDNPLLKVTQLDVVARTNDAGLVKAVTCY
jgi:hypothetical protein